MVYVLLCILANVGIFLCFKGFARYQVNTFQAIVVNYLVCVITGLVYMGNFKAIDEVMHGGTWVVLGMLLGIVFISAFNLMAITTQRLGITVSAIAAKMSLIIPVLISMLLLSVQSKAYTAFNVLGILLAIMAILLSSVKKRIGVKNAPTDYMVFFLPFSVFLLSGFLDTSMNYINLTYLNPQIEAVFPIVIFASAFVLGVGVLLVRRSKLKVKNVVAGIVLGFVNYFSIYLLLKSLSSFNNDGALVYPVLNVGIVLASAFVSILVFKEPLLKVNKIGLAIAVLSMLLIFHQEVMVLIG